MRLLLASLLATTLLGCGGDLDVVASLELRVDLPTQSGEITSALVQVRREAGGVFDTGFEDETLAPVALGTSRVEDAISVLTADAAAELKVRLRFCGDAGCAADAPSQRFILRRPFYADERTFYRIFAEDPTIDVPDPIEVDRCQIRGCVDADPSTFCDTTGMHFCEGAHPPGPVPGAVSARVVEIE